MSAESFDLDEFVSECRGALAETQSQLAVRDVVSRAISRPLSIETALGAVDGWQIETLFHGQEMTILHFVWPPGVDLLAHDHQMWATIGIYGGREANTFYRREGDSLKVSGHKEGAPGDVLLIGSDGIHSVTNPSRQWTAAIHVYGGDFFNTPRTQWDPGTGEPEPFDIANSRRVLAEADAQARRSGILDI